MNPNSIEITHVTTLDFDELVERLKPEQVLNLQHAICASSKLPIATLREAVNAPSYDDMSVPPPISDWSKLVFDTAVSLSAAQAAQVRG